MARLQIAVLISGNGETLQSIIDAQDKGHIDADICFRYRWCWHQVAFGN